MNKANWSQWKRWCIICNMTFAMMGALAWQVAIYLIKFWFLWVLRGGSHGDLNFIFSSPGFTPSLCVIPLLFFYLFGLCVFVCALSASPFTAWLLRCGYHLSLIVVAGKNLNFCFYHCSWWILLPLSRTYQNITHSHSCHITLVISFVSLLTVKLLFIERYLCPTCELC